MHTGFFGDRYMHNSFDDLFDMYNFFDRNITKNDLFHFHFLLHFLDNNLKTAR